MLLTVSKRLEFSASRRLFDPKIPARENVARYGEESAARYGTGRNYVAYFIFSGAVDPAHGMLMNISEIKRRVGPIIEGFDHKFLNDDHAHFADVVPTAENVARRLFMEAQPCFNDSAAKLAACHLVESAERSATYYANGNCEGNYWFEFSAARQTMSPQLSASENEHLFGAAASPHGHGHHYRARLTLPPEAEGVAAVLHSLGQELDHKNLNHEVRGLEGRPVTTESFAAYIFERAQSTLPITRLRLHERDDFFAEYWEGAKYFLGLRRGFSAVHRLHLRDLSEAQNTELFGKCNNPRGHGHTYMAEATIGGEYNARSGTLASFTGFSRALENAIRPWRDKHLDLETEQFRTLPSTGENIVGALWQRTESLLANPLERLRLWETANNRFTLRRAE